MEPKKGSPKKDFPVWLNLLLIIPMMLIWLLIVPIGFGTMIGIMELTKGIHMVDGLGHQTPLETCFWLGVSGGIATFVVLIYAHICVQIERMFQLRP